MAAWSEVMAPLRFQEMAATLSLRVVRVSSWRLKRRVAISACARMLACSKSLFVRLLVVLVVETMHCCMSSEKQACHMAGGFSRCKEHSPNALLGSVHRANHRWIVRHNLHEPGRTVGDAVGESFEVHQVGPKVGSDLHVMLVSMRESQLEGPKETGGPQDGGSHEVEFAKQPLQFPDTNLPFVVEVLKDG